MRGAAMGLGASIRTGVFSPLGLLNIPMFALPEIGIMNNPMLGGAKGKTLIQTYKDEGHFGHETSKKTGEVAGYSIAASSGMIAGAKLGGTIGFAIGAPFGGVGGVVGGGIGAIVGGAIGMKAGDIVGRPIGKFIGGGTHDAIVGAKHLIGLG
jgi:hypothetical protein